MALADYDPQRSSLDWLDRRKPDILCLQEVRAWRDQVKDDLLSPAGYNSRWVVAEKKGYAGTATWSRSPLTLVGTVLGRNLSGTPDYPCRINAVPRPIPEKKWFMEPLVIVMLGGVLPFGSIFIEM